MLPALEPIGRVTPTPTTVMGATGTATRLVPATMTLGRATLSTAGELLIVLSVIYGSLAVVPRAPSRLVECPTPPTQTTTRAIPPPSTSNLRAMLQGVASSSASILSLKDPWAKLKC